MRRYLVRRLGQLVVVLLGASTLVFGLLRLSGDPAVLFVGPDASHEDVARVRAELGFDDPLPVQYLRFLSRAAVGDFGLSLRYDRPALEMVAESFPATLELTLAALLLSTLLAVPAGVLAGVYRGSLYDNAAMVGSLLGQSVPTFWLGIMLIVFLAVQVPLLPTSGRGTWAHLVLPAVTLGTFSVARIARLTRSGMLEVLTQDYIRTARAKGTGEGRVVFRHALRNAALSALTVVSFTLSALVGGAIITETIFAWPGVGRLLLQGVSVRDYPLVQAAVFVIALFVTAINLLTDLLYAVLDPRIQYG
jgi:peptide/nickel transport system permease protein